MKRKIAVFFTVFALIAAVGASAVFAADGNNSNLTNLKLKFDYMRDWTKDATEKGQITPEEAEQWNEHFAEMEKFHEENGFLGYCGGFMGRGVTFDGKNQSYGPKPWGMMKGLHHGGMMGGYGHRRMRYAPAK